MYFPYLRGKRFELSALKTISSLLINYPDKVSPIIEPVKFSKDLQRSVTHLLQKNINFTLIINPDTGEANTGELIDYLLENFKDTKNYQIGLIVDIDTNIEEYLEKIEQLNNKGITLIYKAVRDDVKRLIEIITSKYEIIYNVVYIEKTGPRFYQQIPPKTVILLEDHFKKLETNAKYLDIEKTTFSDEHIQFSRDNFKGFSDFSIIGDNYMESGGPAKAVVIHFPDFDNERKLIVHHFTSDNNTDTSNPGGKFLEALDKWNGWYEASTIETIGSRQYKDYHTRQHYPGLGTLKKNSIEHHIELLIKFLS